MWFLNPASNYAYVADDVAVCVIGARQRGKDENSACAAEMNDMLTRGRCSSSRATGCSSAAEDAEGAARDVQTDPSRRCD